MYDPFPPSPILHLTGPQSNTTAPLSIVEQLDRYRANRGTPAQHTRSNMKPREHIAEGIADHWARLHSSRAGLRSLAEAESALAQRITRL